MPNRELANKSFFNSSTNVLLFQTNNLPTVNLFSNTGIDLLNKQTPDNYDEVRGRKLSYSLNSSKDNSMDSMAFSRLYHEKMEQNNDMDVNDDNKAPSELSYEATQERDICLRMVAKNYKDMLPSQGKLTNNNYLQHVLEMNTKSTPTCGSTAQNEESTFINIPLSYDPDAPSDPKT